MATIRTSIELQDNFTQVLYQVVDSVNLGLSAMDDLRQSMNAPVDSNAFDGARNSINEATMAIQELEAAMQGLDASAMDVPKAIVQLPDPVQWRAEPLQVFTETGTERLLQEADSANRMLNDLYTSQVRIAQQAAGIDLFPETAVRDLYGISSRINEIQLKVETLESNSLDMGTDAANAQLEYLRGQLSEAVQEQESLNRAVENMDVAKANEAYLRLSRTVGNTERYIRDNVDEQGRFNQEIERGTHKADNLMGSIKRMVAMYAGIQTVGKVIDLSDQLTSNTARLNLIVEDGGSVAELEAKIMASAERARAPYLDTASAISKLGANARSAFSGNDELIAFMEQVNKQFAIGGASVQEQSNAMVQLTQAMSAGTLRGEELNSILDQAPGIARAIEQYMGAAEGSIKSYAEDGLISAQVVKNALFAAADQTNAKFESMPQTFAQIWTSIKNQALEAFRPILQRINDIANSARFQQFVTNAVALIQRIASVAAGIFEFFMGIVNIIADNWGIIEPILIGVAAGLVAMKIATLAQAAATWVATAAQNGLNLSMLACPATWIAIAIAAVVAAVLWLGKAVGGLDVLWKYAWASMQVAFFYARAAIESGFWWMVYGLMWAGDKLIYAWEEIKLAAFRIFNAIADFFGQIGASIMLGLQGVVNGAIWILNQMIGGLNNTLGWIGVNVQEIGYVTFGDEAQANADAAARQRANAYQAYADQVEADRQARQNDLAGMADRASSAWTDNVNAASQAWQKAVDYQAEVQARNAAAEAQSNEDAWNLNGYGSAGQNLADINDNTKKMADGLEISGEDLKYLRDLAERDVINRFTTAEIKVEMTNHNTITDNRDLDGLMDSLGEKAQELLVSTAEGVHV